MGKRFGELPAGKWLLEDKNAFECAVRAERGTAFIEHQYFHENGGLSNSLCILRSGAIGDLLFLSPAVRAFKKKNPTVRVALSCFPDMADLFEGTDLFDEIETYPLPFEVVADKYYQVIDLGNVMESATTVHATDAFAASLDVKVTDYKPTYRVASFEAKEAAGIEILNTTRPKLGVQMRSSQLNRDYPLSQWMRVIMELESRGWAIFMFGLKGQIPDFPPEFRRPHIYDMTQLEFSFRQTAAIVARMDVFCGVDSSLIHLCSALDIPALGLYGAFDWKIRTSKAPFTKVLSGFGDCAPCNFHFHNGHHFPPDKPCSKTGRCSVIGSIHPDRIVAKIEQMRK